MTRRMRSFLLGSCVLTPTLLCSGRVQAQCLVNPDTIKPVVGRDGSVLGFVFPKRDAQKYEHYANVLVPDLTHVVDGLQQEKELLSKKAQLQDNVVGLLQQNESDLKGVVGKLDAAIDKQETVIGIQRSQIRSANREKWVWRGIAGIAVGAAILK